MAKAQGIFEAAGKAPMKEYTDLTGKEHRECPGGYNDYMVRAMAHDMTKAHLALKDTPFGDRLTSWMPRMTTLNTEIMRMADDLNGDRPVKAQNLKKWNRFRAEIEDIMRAPEVRGCYIKDLADRMKVWDERLAYQMAWVYYLRENYAMNFLEAQFGCTEDGSDKSPTTGLTPAEEAQIKNINEVRRIMLDTFLKVPVSAPEHTECQAKLEDLARAADTILDHAADDFIDAEEEDTPAQKSVQSEKVLEEDDARELSDVLVAIRTVAGKLVSKLSDENTEISLKDKVVTGRVLLSRFESRMNDSDDHLLIAKGTVEMLRSLADDIELEALLA